MSIKEFIADATKHIAEKTSEYAKLLEANVELDRYKKKRDNLFIEVGKKIYTYYKNNYEEVGLQNLESEFKEIDKLNEEIHSLEEKIKEIKGQKEEEEDKSNNETK